jgi:hypothetical protein
MLITTSVYSDQFEQNVYDKLAHSTTYAHSESGEGKVFPNTTP